MDNSENVKNCQHCSNCCNNDTETYLEIYKLQMDVITNTSNRRINVNRYYILALSVLVLALSVALKSGSELIGIVNPSNLDLNSKSIAFAVAATGVLGSILTWSWLLNMVGYLHSNNKRYEVIKVLECSLPYQFIQSVWKLMPVEVNKKYFDFAFHELLAPFVFCLGFMMLAIFGFYVYFFGDSKHLSFLFIAGAVILIVLFYKVSSKGRKEK